MTDTSGLRHKTNTTRKLCIALLVKQNNKMLIYLYLYII